MESWRQCMFSRISGYIEIHWNMFYKISDLKWKRNSPLS
jgi:hypothetical protein